MLSVVSLMYANFVLEVQLNNRNSVRTVATGLVRFQPDHFLELTQKLYYSLHGVLFE